MTRKTKIILLACSIILILITAIVISVILIQKRTREVYIENNGISTIQEISESIPFESKLIELQNLPENIELTYTQEDSILNTGSSGTKTYKYEVVIDKNNGETLDKKLIEEKITRMPINETKIIGKTKISNNQDFMNSEIYKFAEVSRNALNNNEWEYIYNNMASSNLVKRILSIDSFKEINESFLPYSTNDPFGSIKMIFEKNYSMDENIPTYVFTDYFSPKIITVDNNKYVSINLNNQNNSKKLNLILEFDTNKMYFNTDEMFIIKFDLGPKVKAPSINTKDPNIDYQLGYIQFTSGGILLVKPLFFVNGKYENSFYLLSEFVNKDKTTKSIGDIIDNSINIKDIEYLKVYYQPWYGKEVFDYKIYNFQQYFDNQSKVPQI